MKHIMPYREDFFAPLQTQFNKFYDEFFRANPLSSVKAVEFPKINAYEENDKLYLEELMNLIEEILI